MKVLRGGEALMIHRHRGSSSSSTTNKVPKNHRQGIQPSLYGRTSISHRSRQVRRKNASYHLIPFRRRPLIISGLLFLYLAVTLYLHPEWLLAFRNDHDGVANPQRLPLAQQEKKQHLEHPRPNNEELFTAFTGKEKKILKNMRQSFLQQKENKELVPCRLDGDCQWTTIGSNSLLSLLLGSSVEKYKVKLHNPLPFHRYFCGKVIWGNGGTLDLEGSEATRCVNGALPYVHSNYTPPLSGKDMKPVELFSNFDSTYDYDDDRFDHNSFETEEFPCPVPCRKADGGGTIVNVISIKDTKWEFIATMEGEKYYGEAKVKATSHRHDHFYATTSFQSDIPLPYFSWSEYDIQHIPPVDFDKAIKGASFLAKNCDSYSKREDLLLALMETSLRVDSLSSCHQNAEPPRGVNMENKTAIQERYLFHLAFENQISEDYITEKLWGALAAGTLPIYFGAPNAQDHVPPRSVVFVDDFASPQDLADYLILLTKDKALYESYHAWRYQPIDPNFRQRYEFTNTHSTCRMCKWAYAKMHGFGWNHTRQEIQEPRIPHKTCRNKVGLIGHPFKEYWVDESVETSVPIESSVRTKSCTMDDSNRLVLIDGGIFQRKVYDHDGITDIIIDALKTGGHGYQLRLETPIVTSNLQKILESDGREWWLQDSLSRMTILTSQPVEMSLIRQGTIQFEVLSHLRVRVIVENIDTFHKGARKHANYFGNLMKDDFFSPIEAYKVTTSNH